MNAPCILLMLLALGGVAAADTPKRVPLMNYQKLWTDSPFTSKPPDKGDEPEEDILKDYALLGVSPILGGYRVTLLNKKKPEDRITVDSGKTVEGFTVLAVNRKAGDPLGTVVRMRHDSFTGNVAFDEKLLAAPTPQPTAKTPPTKPGGPALQPQIQPSGQVMRQPRPRVVPPPPAQGQPQAIPQGQPQGIPQAQPQFQGQPQQIQPQAQPLPAGGLESRRPRRNR